MAWTMLLAFIAFTLSFAWMVARRMELERLRLGGTSRTLEEQLVARRAEGVPA